MRQNPTNVISRDVHIKGVLTFKNDLISDGQIEGDINSTGSLVVGRNGSVQGDIRAGAVSIAGSVNGNVTVREKCELKTAAALIGDLVAPRLIIEEGATFVGRSQVTPHGEQPAVEEQETPPPQE